jgi:hypothetical protein
MRIDLGPFEAEVIHTPGHTADSLSILIDYPLHVFEKSSQDDRLHMPVLPGRIPLQPRSELEALGGSVPKCHFCTIPLSVIIAEIN